MKALVKLDNPVARHKAAEWVRNAPDGHLMEIREPRRSNDQNDLMWQLLSEIAEQATHAGLKFSAEDWKELLMAQLMKELRLVPNLDGDGFVTLGRRTSKLTRHEFSDLIELIYMLAANKGVVFSEAPAKPDSGEARAA